MQDKELIEKLQAKDPAAFKSLFERYSPMVFNVCCRMLANTQESEDITQDVFINIYNSIKQFRGDSKLSTWLYRITVNHCLNFQAKKKLQRWLSFDLFRHDESKQNAILIDLDENKPDVITEKKETEAIIQNIINSLPVQQRIALILHRYEGLSYDEIAKIMNCSISSVESRIFRAKQNISKKLLPYLNQL